MIPLKTSLRRRALLGMQKAMYWTGGAAAYVRAKAIHGATILLYHSIPTVQGAEWIDPANAMSPELFEAQMDFLAHRRQVISMSELVQRVKNHHTLDAGTVVITFDDGYLDNLQVAVPILQRYRLPAIFYLATNAINQGFLWIDQLHTMFQRRTRHQLRLETGSGSLDIPATRSAIYRAIADVLSRADVEQRHFILTSIQEQLQPSAAPPRLMLNWDEARQLNKQYPAIEIGLHTADHLDLVANESLAEEQIERSQLDLERQLGIRAKHFSFPYGRFSVHSQNVIRDLGLESAVVAGANCLIDAGSNPFALARISAPQSTSLLGFWTSGAYPGLSKALL
ncbi:MAG TPA: polysaccharide deacetylase family protein, partial [Tepidisphaeraceae bacterium]|nr:polysaccharide deacetylase family protein [Tepidisphaeraceae bacterium]